MVSVRRSAQSGGFQAIGIRGGGPVIISGGAGKGLRRASDLEDIFERNPLFDPLRAQPKFREILKRMGLQPNASELKYA